MVRRSSVAFSLLAVFFFLARQVNAEEPPLDITPAEPPISSILFKPIQLMVRTSPNDPFNERFLDDWLIELHPIDDDGNISGPVYYGKTDSYGNTTMTIPEYPFARPIVVKAHNKMLPTFDGDDLTDSRQFEIFVPANCHDKAPWLLGPFEDALWSYYREAAKKKAEAWNPSQVDCGTWLANLQLLILTDEIQDELDRKDPDTRFNKEALFTALQKNQHLLVATRPPMCFAERRHQAGSMNQGHDIALSAGNGYIVLDNTMKAKSNALYVKDDDPVLVNPRLGTVENICGVRIADETLLKINDAIFAPNKHFWLDDEDFLGTIHQHLNIRPDLHSTVFNTRLGNGREANLAVYDDACAVTSVVEFENVSNDEQELQPGTGVYFANLFAGSNPNTTVHLTSDGDALVDQNDTWALFTRSGDTIGEEMVLAVELLGHRQEDFRDGLYMSYQRDSEDLFIGLRRGHELNEEEVDGEKAYLNYTIHVWDGSTAEGRRAIRKDLLNCYESADIWARQFFGSPKSPPSSLEAAEFAVRSQCFSNSRANQRWRTDDIGYWSINSDHGVQGNVIINSGWLAPNMSFEIYIQKYDEAVFRGPRTVVETDALGQLMVALFTLVEGDRVLLKSTKKCCDDYDLVMPCVPEFTGFAGSPGVPYVPVTLGPPPPAPCDCCSSCPTHTCTSGAN